MNFFAIFGIFLVLAPAVFFLELESDTFKDLQHVNDSTIVVGEGETCRGGNIEATCLPGYDCVLISTYPEIHGICKSTNHKDPSEYNIDDLDDFEYNVT